MAFSKPDFLKSPLEHFRDRIESLMQGKAAIFREKSKMKGPRFVYTLTFEASPKDPMITFSYGASFAVTPTQKQKVELCLQMHSTDMAWAHVVGYLANHLRGDCPFNHGEIIRFGQPISQDSKLNTFVVSYPTLAGFQNLIFDGKKSSGLQVMELIPIYEEEVLSIARLGLDRFLSFVKPIKTDPKRKSI